MDQPSARHDSAPGRPRCHWRQRPLSLPTSRTPWIRAGCKRRPARAPPPASSSGTARRWISTSCYQGGNQMGGDANFALPQVKRLRSDTPWPPPVPRPGRPGRQGGRAAASRPSRGPGGAPRGCDWPVALATGRCERRPTATMLVVLPRGPNRGGPWTSPRSSTISSNVPPMPRRPPRRPARQMGRKLTPPTRSSSPPGRSTTRGWPCWTPSTPGSTPTNSPSNQPGSLGPAVAAMAVRSATAAGPWRSPSTLGPPSSGRMVRITAVPTVPPSATVMTRADNPKEEA